MEIHFWRKHQQFLLLITAADSVLLFTPTRELLLNMRAHIIQRKFHSAVLLVQKFFEKNISCKATYTLTILLDISNAFFVAVHFVTVAVLLDTSVLIAWLFKIIIIRTVFLVTAATKRLFCGEKKCQDKIFLKNFFRYMFKYCFGYWNIFH